MAEDLGLTEDDVQANLNLSGVKVGETIGTAMTPAHAQPCFGKMPPDLSLIARVRGSDWIYTYLKSFYLDESRPVGWNNTLFPNVSMPNPLWEMQGVQHAVLAKPNARRRAARRAPGTAFSPARSRPSSSTRASATSPLSSSTPANRPPSSARALGVWVILFLAAFTFLAYLVKKEYWKDVH